MKVYISVDIEGVAGSTSWNSTVLGDVEHPAMAREMTLEAAAACRDYAFHTLGMERVYSIIRDTNLASQNVAKRNGMSVCGSFTKHYYGMDMPHLVFCVSKKEDF